MNFEIYASFAISVMEPDNKKSLAHPFIVLRETPYIKEKLL